MNEKENLYKVFQKKLEEKDNKIKELEIFKKKRKKREDNKKIKYELNIKFIDSVKDLNKKLELNDKKLEELNEKDEK